jgi:hypothetical protein
MVRDSQFDDLLPSIIYGDFWLQGHMWRNMNARDVLKLERGSFWLSVYYSMTNPFKEPILEPLVQFLGINIKRDGKSRPSRTTVPISLASVISSIVAPTKKSHHVAIVCQ